MKLGFLLCVTCRLLAVIRLSRVTGDQLRLFDVENLSLHLDLIDRFFGLGLRFILGGWFVFAFLVRLAFVLWFYPDSLLVGDLVAFWVTLCGFLRLRTQTLKCLI